MEIELDGMKADRRLGRPPRWRAPLPLWKATINSTNATNGDSICLWLESDGECLTSVDWSD